MAIGRRKSRSFRVNLGEKTKQFQTPNRPTKLKLRTNSGNAWGYWLITFNNQILLEDPNGSVGTSEYVGPYWLEADETEQVELVLSVPPVPSHSHINKLLDLPCRGRRYIRRHQRIIFNC